MIKKMTVLSLAFATMLPSVLAAQSAKSPAPAQDEVTELLEEARAAYHKGYYKLSSTRMNQALSLIRQLESQRAHKIFPAAQEGWATSEDGNENLNKFKSLGIGSVFATGLTYTKGEQSVQMILVQKPSSPQPLFDLVLAGLLMPRPGMEKFPVGPYTAHYLCATSNPTDCDMTIPVASDYVVLINGKGVSRDALQAQAKAIRFDLLESFR